MKEDIARRAAARDDYTAGNSRATKRPIIAITTNSSTSENPRRRELTFWLMCRILFVIGNRSASRPPPHSPRPSPGLRLPRHPHQQIYCPRVKPRVNATQLHREQHFNACELDSAATHSPPRQSRPSRSRRSARFESGGRQPPWWASRGPEAATAPQRPDSP